MSDKFEIQFIAGRIYSINLPSDTILFFSPSDTAFQFQEEAISQLGLVTDVRNVKLQQFVTRLKFVKEQQKEKMSSIDTLSAQFQNKKISYNEYSNKKNILLKTSNRYLDSVKRNIWRELMDTATQQTILAPFILLHDISKDKKLYNLDSDSIYFNSVIGSINKKSNPAPQFIAFRNYVKAYKEFLEYETVRLASTRPGSPIGSIILPAANGELISFESLYSKKSFSLLLIVRNSCESCRDERIFLSNILSAQKSSLSVYEISIDEPGGITQWKKNISMNKLPWAQVLDTSTGENRLTNRFKISSTPYSILVDKEGRIIKSGASRKDIEEVL